MQHLSSGFFNPRLLKSKLDFPPLFLLDVLRFELVLFVHQAAARLMNKWECQDVLRLRKKKDLDQLKRPKS